TVPRITLPRKRCLLLFADQFVKLGKLFNTRCVIAGFLINIAEVRMGVRKIRIDLDGLLELLDAFVVTPGVIEEVSKILIDDERKRVKLEGAPRFHECFFVPAKR